MQRVPPLVYIYKEECLSVCSLCIPIPFNRFWWNLPGMIPTYRGRSTSTWFEKKTNPTHATSNLWNWPIGLQHSKKWKKPVAKAAEGRLSAHIQHLTWSICLSQPYRCYRQPLKLTNGIAAFQRMQIAASEGGQRPSERSDTTPHVFHLPAAILRMLQAACITDQ